MGNLIPSVSVTSFPFLCLVFIFLMFYKFQKAVSLKSVNTFISLTLFKNWNAQYLPVWTPQRWERLNVMIAALLANSNGGGLKTKLEPAVIGGVGTTTTKMQLFKKKRTRSAWCEQDWRWELSWSANLQPHSEFQNHIWRSSYWEFAYCGLERMQNSCWDWHRNF